MKKGARTAVVQPVGEKTPGRPCCALSVYNGSLWESFSERHFTSVCSDRTRGNGLKWKRVGWDLIEERLFYDEGGEILEQLAQRSHNVLLLDTFNVKLEGPLRNLV